MEDTTFERSAHDHVAAMIREKIDRIKELAKKQFVMESSSIHGFDHWEQVLINGLMLSMQHGVDPIVVELFAYLHDCKREEDHGDYEHGDRAADYVMELRSAGELDFLTHMQYSLLWEACRLHHTGVTADDSMTIGVCFDADRIELIRCGITPKSELMSTAMGKRIAQKLEQHKRFTYDKI
jgi:uncharacterized protein